MMRRMIMLMRLISALLWVACLTACVSGTAPVRNKRQFEDLYYGKCGKPTMTIPHGGIKLFPTYGGITNPKENSCYSCYPACPPCEPMFYCDDGYNMKGFFHLFCVQNRSTYPHIYKWEGSIPTCEENTLPDTFRQIIPAMILPISLMLLVVIGACRAHARRNRATNGQAVRRTGIRSNFTTISIAPSSWRPVGGRTPGLLTNSGPPSYSRFDDSNVEVPRDVSPPTTDNVEVTPTEAAASDDDPPPYTTAQLNAYTQENTREDGVEPASAPIIS